VIKDLQVQRVSCMKARTRQDNATGALVRRFCGYTPDARKFHAEHSDGMTERERTAICKRAAGIVKAVETGAELTGDDVVIGDKLRSFIVNAALARKPFDDMIADIEKRMVKLAKTLPAWPWVESVRGFGAKGFAIIVGEAGDLSSYSGPAKLWKRMGVGLVGANRQGAPGTGATAEDWIAHGYNPRRRSSLWNIGDPMIKQGAEYRQVYLDRKEYEIALHPEMSKLHAHRRAQRYMEKRLLRDLWLAWRDASPGEA
jgi:hypothetical protein